MSETTQNLGDYIMPWGKYQGKKLDDIPDYYLKWLHEESTTRDANIRNYLTENIDAIRKNLEDKKR